MSTEQSTCLRSYKNWLKEDLKRSHLSLTLNKIREELNEQVLVVNRLAEEINSLRNNMSIEELQEVITQLELDEDIAFLMTVNHKS